MKLVRQFLSFLLSLCLMLSVFSVIATPKAEAAGAADALSTGASLVKFGVTTTLTVASLIAKNNGDAETAAMLSKWTFPGGTVMVPMLQELGKQMTKMHEEVMQELDFIENKLDKNMSGIQSSLGTAAANNAYDNLLEAWNSDITVPMAFNGYHNVVNAYKTYLEYAGSYMTGTTITHGGQQIVATEQMVRDCQETFYSALVTMSEASYDANSDLSAEEYYNHILYETNTIDLKVYATVNNLLNRMLNASGAPAGGRYIDRAAQAAFAYFPFSEDQAAFVDAAVQKQAYEINMALMAYQEFIGMRMEYCAAKYEAAQTAGASEEELAALQTKLDQYCSPNTSVLNLLYGGAPCVHPGGVVASMETWLAAPVYISTSVNSYVYLDNYLRSTGTQKFTLTNSNFITETDPNVLLQESSDDIISQLVAITFSGPLNEDPKNLVSQTSLTGEQTQFIRRGVVVPTQDGQALVKPIYMVVDETEDKSGMFMSNLQHTYRPIAYPSDFIVPNADFYNLRDGIYTDGNNTYTLTTGSRLQKLTGYNPLSLGAGLLQNYFKSVIGTYPESRNMYVLTAATKGETKTFGYKHSGINMVTSATFIEEEIPSAEHSSTSYMVVLDSTADDTYVSLATLADEGISISVTGDCYDSATGKAKAGTSVNVTVAPNGNDIPKITAAYHEDLGNPTKVTYAQELLDEEQANAMLSDDGTLTFQFAVPYSNVTIVAGKVDSSVCAHPADQQETSCAHQSYGSHSLLVECGNCGEILSSTREDCYDLDNNDLCDICNFSLVCPHPEDRRILQITNYYGMHSIYEACADCGLTIRNVTEPCVDENNDGVCEICNGDAQCPHNPYWWNSVVESNGDGTHTVHRTCTNCGNVDSQDVYPCYDGDDDGRCDSCDYLLTSCPHENWKTDIIPHEGANTHSIITNCADCENAAMTSVGKCWDDDGDGKCDYCGNTIVCYHNADYTKIIYESNQDGTHNVIVACLCGEVRLDSRTESCVDEDSDSHCDLCNYAEASEPSVDGDIKIGAQLYLENDLTMTFRVKSSYLSDYDLSTAYMVVEREIYRSGEAEAFVDTTTIGEYTMDGDRLVFAYPGIAAAQMNDAIRATLYIKTADGDEYVSPVLNTSVTTYLDGLLKATSTGEKLIVLIMDMVNYGTAAQIHFDRHTAALANQAFETFETYKSYASVDFRTALEDLAATENTEGMPGKLTIGLDLGTRIGIQYKVTVPSDVNVEDVTLVITDAEGNILETLPVAGNATDNKARYIVNYYGATARDMRRVVYATAYANGTAITGTYAYSISTYAWGIQENASTIDENLVNVTRMMMLYGDSANDYFE